jgi:mRNA interferase MazF
LAAKTRPVVVVSRSDAPGAPVIYVPLTSQNRESRYDIPLPKLSFLNSASVANVQGIGSVPTVRLERRLGKLPENTLAEIGKALSSALDLAGLSQ